MEVQQFSNTTMMSILLTHDYNYQIQKSIEDLLKKNHLLFFTNKLKFLQEINQALGAGRIRKWY